MPRKVYALETTMKSLLIGVVRVLTCHCFGKRKASIADYETSRSLSAVPLPQSRILSCHSLGRVADASSNTSNLSLLSPKESSSLISNSQRSPNGFRIRPKVRSLRGHARTIVYYRGEARRVVRTKVRSSTAAPIISLEVPGRDRRGSVK